MLVHVFNDGTGCSVKPPKFVWILMLDRPITVSPAAGNTVMLFAAANPPTSSAGA
jgi:hypothetical protein